MVWSFALVFLGCGVALCFVLCGVSLFFWFLSFASKFFFCTPSATVRSLLVSNDLFIHWPSNQTELFLLTSIAWNKKTWDLQYVAIRGE